MSENRILETIQLTTGRHETREAGMCATELTAFLAGEQHSDQPKCACPTISSLVRGVNDLLSVEERQKLKDVAVRLIGTASTDPTLQEKRTLLVADFFLRSVVPTFVSLTGLAPELLKDVKSWPAISRWEELYFVRSQIRQATTLINDALTKEYQEVGFKQLQGVEQPDQALLTQATENVSRVARETAARADVSGITRLAGVLFVGATAENAAWYEVGAEALDCCHGAVKLVLLRKEDHVLYSNFSWLMTQTMLVIEQLLGLQTMQNDSFDFDLEKERAALTKVLGPQSAGGTVPTIGLSDFAHGRD